MNQWIEVAQAAGWKVVKTGKDSGHLKFFSPHGPIIVTSISPGQGRSVANDRARLRRAGLDV